MLKVTGMQTRKLYLKRSDHGELRPNESSGIIYLWCLLAQHFSNFFFFLHVIKLVIEKIIDFAIILWLSGGRIYFFSELYNN